MNQADQKQMDALCPDLQPLLAAELKVGNQILYAHQDDATQAITIMLRGPFRIRKGLLPKSVVYSHERVPQWKADYRCQTHRHMLACQAE